MPFIDDFNRADGPLGANWTTIFGSPAIVSNAASSSGWAGAYCSGYNAGASQDMTMYVRINAGAASECRLLTVYNPANHYCQAICVSVGANNIYVSAKSGDATDLANIVSRTYAGEGVGAQVVVRAVSVGRSLTWYINGIERETVTAQDLAYGSYFGIETAGSGAQIDAINTSDYVPRSLEITPDPLWVGGGPCLITATGTGTEWTDGDDPSTVFSADHGTVEVYRFVSATEWELIYTPTEYIGTITFSETQYGLEDTVNGVLTPPTEGGNGICQLTPAGAELVNSSTPGDDRKLVTDHTLVVAGFEQVPELPYLDAISDIWYATHSDLNLPGGVETVVEGITKLWQAINGITDIGGGPWDPSYGEPLGATIAKLRDSWLIGAGPNCYSVQDIIDAIGQGGGGLEQNIRNDIGIENNGTWTSLLQVLLGLWGPGADTITTLGTRLDTLVTISGWTLGNVKTWIEDIPSTDLTPVTHKLDHIQPDEGDTLSTIQTQADAIKLVVDQIQTSLGAYRTGSNYTVQDILDAIDALSDKIDALPTDSAPVWPGSGNVTLGTPVAYSDNLSIVAPMDGVIVAWTSPPSKTGHYVLGNEHYYYGSGRIAFGTDSGDLEPPQWLGFTSAIYTPQNMRRASAVRFQGVGGAVGTVTPWTRS